MRGNKAKTRQVLADSKFNSPVVAKLVNFVMLDGKKELAQRTIYNVLDKMSEATKKKPLEALDLALSNIKPKIEVRSRRVGGANYQVPVPVSESRQLALALRWVISAARDHRGNKSFEEAIYSELLAATKKEGSAYKKKEDTHKMAEANKAFSHLSW